MCLVLYHINLAKLDHGSKSSLPEWFPVRLGQGHVCAIFTSWKRSSAICSEGQCSTLLIICWLALLAHARCPPSAPPSARPAVCAVHGRVPTSSVTQVVELGGCETPARFHFVFTPSYFTSSVHTLMAVHRRPHPLPTVTARGSSIPSSPAPALATSKGVIKKKFFFLQVGTLGACGISLPRPRIKPASTCYGSAEF